MRPRLRSIAIGLALLLFLVRELSVASPIVENSDDNRSLASESGSDAKNSEQELAQVSRNYRRKKDGAGVSQTQKTGTRKAQKSMTSKARAVDTTNLTLINKTITGSASCKPTKIRLETKGSLPQVSLPKASHNSISQSFSCSSYLDSTSKSFDGNFIFKCVDGDWKMTSSCTEQIPETCVSTAKGSNCSKSNCASGDQIFGVDGLATEAALVKLPEALNNSSIAFSCDDPTKISNDSKGDKKSFSVICKSGEFQISNSNCGEPPGTQAKEKESAAPRS